MREELEKRERTVAAARDEEAAARAKLKVGGGMPEPRSAYPIDGCRANNGLRDREDALLSIPRNVACSRHDVRKRPPMRVVAQSGSWSPGNEIADPAAQTELARLRRDAAQRAAAAAQHQRAAASVAQATSYSAAPTPPAMGANGAAPPPAASEQLLRSLKVSWYLKVSTRTRSGAAFAAVLSRNKLQRARFDACFVSA